MGGACVSSICSQDVNFQEVDMKISKKNVQTLERYGKGSVARREAQKIKLSYIKEITGKLNLFESIHPKFAR